MTMLHNQPSIPEIYANGCNLSVNQYDALISFVERHNENTGESPNPPRVMLRLPLPAAKELSIMLRRIIKQVEEQVGVHVVANREILNKLGIALEDMDKWW